MDVNTLYPVVHDLTDAESSDGWCAASYLCAAPGCFSLHDLVNPEFSAIPISPSSTSHQAEPPPSKPFRRQTTDNPRGRPPYPHLRSLVDDRNDSMASIIEEERKLLFAETYVMTRQVNRGNLSNVWECVHRTTGVRYAAKVIDRRRCGRRDEDLVYAEASVLDQVRGVAGITNLIDFYDEPSHFYMVMDFCDGGDLISNLVKRERIPEEEAKGLAKGLLEGLQYLHEHNVCHRNVKPENLLLRNKQDLSTVVIADFGMATRVLTDADGDVLKLTERCGTASYMAPEVISQIPYDTQVDLWSFGVVMYYALVGKLPFEDESRFDLYHKIVKSDYTFHPRDWLGISKTAKRFIANLLHADPEVRMTVEEALAHPWLASVEPKQMTETAPISQPTTQSTSIPTVEKPLKSPKASKKLKGVWKAISRKRTAAEDEPMDETKSESTVSMISSAATEVCHRRLRSK